MKNILIATLAAMMLATVASAATNSQPSATIAPTPRHQSSIAAKPCNGAVPCNANQAALAPGEGDPMPVCQPGHQCSDDLRRIAGEGDPMPVCQPGHQCSDDVRKGVLAL